MTRIVIYTIKIIHIRPIAKIEAGATPNPTIETVKKIAGALGVSLDERRRRIESGKEITMQSVFEKILKEDERKGYFRLHNGVAKIELK